jgi:3-dehydroquinate dehydratase-1
MKRNQNPVLLDLQTYPMLVASLDGDDLPFLLEEAKTQRADMVELRMDVWNNFFRDGMLEKLARFKQKIGIPMLVTFRGGHPFPSWWQPLHWRALASASLIDVEWNPKYPWKEIRAQAQNLNLGLMISHHDYERTPPAKKLLSFVTAARGKGADLVKIATKVNIEADLRTLFDVSRHFDAKKLGTVMGMGAWGPLSRFAAPVFGSSLVSGFIGSATAIGQSPYKELFERMRILSPRYEAGFQERQKKRGAL